MLLCTKVRRYDSMVVWFYVLGWLRLLFTGSGCLLQDTGSNNYDTLVTLDTSNFFLITSYIYCLLLIADCQFSDF